MAASTSARSSEAELLGNPGSIPYYVQGLSSIAVAEAGMRELFCISKIVLRLCLLAHLHFGQASSPVKSKVSHCSSLDFRIRL